MLDKKIILKAIEKVMDPELGISIIEMNLIDKVEINKGNVFVEFHLSTPACPMEFALKIASDVKEAAQKVSGVKSVKINVVGHYMAEHINKEVNK